MILILVQARLNSKRLFQKALKEVQGKPLLFYTFERLQSIQTPNTTVLATTLGSMDNALVKFADSQKIAVFRGSEHNVLERFYQAAKHYQASWIVRITGDCPLVQPSLLDSMLDFAQNHPQYDYLSNVIERSYPKGMDLEIFSFKALEKAYQEATLAYDLEHVTPYFYQNKTLFNLYNFKYPVNLSKINVSVDTQEDFEFVRNLIEKYTPINPLFELKEMEADLLTLDAER